MKRKIFVNLFFEKKSYLMLYIIIITLFTVYIGLQSIFLEKQFQKSFYPDIVINGSMDEDGVMRYKLYRDIDGVVNELDNTVPDNVNYQKLVERNLLFVNDGINQIEYRVLGMNDKDISIFSNYLSKGSSLPSNGKKEVLLGAYAARYYKLNIGDKIQIPLSLDKDNDTESEGEYTVCGILNDNVDYFKGSLIMSKDTWSAQYGEVADNTILFYFKNDEEYKNVMNSIDSLSKENSATMNIMSNYANNRSAKESFYNNVKFIIALSIVAIIVLLFFLIRGMKKKIGLLKALGLPEKNVIKIFCGGLLLITIFALVLSIGFEFLFVNMLNSKSSSFYGFAVKEYFVNKYSFIAILGVNLINILVATITVISFEKRISPHDAMLSL